MRFQPDPISQHVRQWYGDLGPTIVSHLSTLRCDQLDGDPKEVSPIFTQFLECVWQLTEQFPQVCGLVTRGVFAQSSTSCVLVVFI